MLFENKKLEKIEITRQTGWPVDEQSRDHFNFPFRWTETKMKWANKHLAICSVQIDLNSQCL